METKLCENLKKLRDLHKYSFKDLEKLMAGKNCKVTASTLQRYEAGIIPNVPYDSIIALAEIYDTPPAALMGWSTEPILNLTEKEVLTDFRKLNSFGQDKAADYIHDLTENPKYTEKELSFSTDTA